MASVTAILAHKAAAAVERHGLFEAGERVVVAASGGADSTALLEVLKELREGLGLWLCVAHLNHRLRGRQAEDDAAFVADMARKAGLDVHLGSSDVPAERRCQGGSVEMAARRVRYAFLEQVAADVGAMKVALGHTADDQAETILLRLLRGGGLAALCGMPVARRLSPRSRARVVRPLLDATRADVVGYLTERGLAWRDDESNADVAFLRNWVRHALLPLLEERCGPGFRAALLDVAERARELSGLLDGAAMGLVAGGDGEARLDAAPAARQPRLVLEAAARRAFEGAGGEGELSRRALDAVEGLLAGGSGRRVMLAGGVVAERCYGEVRFGRPSRAAARVAAALSVPGRVELPEVGMWLEAEVVDSSGPATRSSQLAARNSPRWSEVVDLDRVGEGLVVRTRERGDRFEPLGLGASKKLKDFLIDEHVPREERERTLVVAGRSGIAWVVGLRLDERAKVGPATTRVGRLRAGALRGTQDP